MIVWGIEIVVPRSLVGMRICYQSFDCMKLNFTTVVDYASVFQANNKFGHIHFQFELGILSGSMFFLARIKLEYTELS
jgi:hypothetical protein